MRFSLLLTVLFTAIAVAGENVEYSPFNRLQNWSFESGLIGWVLPKWAPCDVNAEIDATVAVDGNRSIHFSGRGGDSFMILQGVKCDAKSSASYRFSCYVKTEGVTAGGWNPVLQCEQITMAGGKEQFKYFAARPAAKKINDFTLYECVFDIVPETTSVRVLLHGKAPNGAPAWQVWIDAVDLSDQPKVENRLTLKDFLPGGEHGLFMNGEKPSFEVTAVNLFNTPVNAKFSGEVFDFYGRSIEKFTREIQLKKLGAKNISLTLNTIPALLGFYSVHLKISTPQNAAELIGSFTVVMPREKRDEFFGFCGYGLLGYEKAAAMLNAGSGGMPFYWIIEGSQDKIDWRETDIRLDGLRKNKLRPIGTVLVSGMHNTIPRWISEPMEQRIKQGQSPHNEEYFARANYFTEQIVRRYAGEINNWSATLEIDLAQHLNKYELPHYLRRIKDFYSIVKSVNPALTVNAIGVSGCDMQSNPPLNDTRKLMELLHNHLDGIAFDAYINPCSFGPGRRPIGPERGNLLGLMRETVKISGQYGKEKFAIDEMGFNVINHQSKTLPPDSIFDKDLAAVLARSYIIAKSVPEMTHWLYFKIQGSLQGELDWSIFLNNAMPRPAAAAYATVADRLAFAQSPRKIELHNDIWAIVFSRGNQQIAALWSIAPENVSVLMEFPVDAMSYDLMNNPTKLGKGKRELILSSCPIFIEINTSSDKVDNMIKKADFALPQVAASAELAATDILTVTVRNLSGHSVNTTVSVTSKGGEIITPLEQKLRLGANSKGNIDFTVVNLQGTVEFKLEVKVGERSYYFDYQASIINVPRLQGNFSFIEPLNGANLDQSIDLSGLNTLSPVDASPNGLWTGTDDLSAKACLAYDEKNLYLAVDVTDDIQVNNVSGARIWSRDSIQFALAFPSGNSDGKNVNAGYGPQDWEFGMGLTPGGAELYCYRAPAATRCTATSIKDIPFTVTAVSPNRMIYRVALPWQKLGVKCNPRLLLGFNLVILDSDEPNTTCNYWMQLSGGIVNGKNPSLFPRIILKK